MKFSSREGGGGPVVEEPVLWESLPVPPASLFEDVLEAPPELKRGLGGQTVGGQVRVKLGLVEHLEGGGGGGG